MNPEFKMDISWVQICDLQDIVPNTGVTCLVGGRPIALFRVGPDDAMYALDAFDPFCDAYVLGRGMVGCHQGKPKVASPMYKQSFCLETGVCIDDPSVKLDTFGVRLDHGKVLVRVVATHKLRSGNQPLLREGRA